MRYYDESQRVFDTQMMCTMWLILWIVIKDEILSKYLISFDLTIYMLLFEY